MSVIVHHWFFYSKNNFTIAYFNLLKFDYNYILFHKSLREKISENSEKFKKHYQQNTPAMKMGLTGKALNWRFLLTIPILTSG